MYKLFLILGLSIMSSSLLAQNNTLYDNIYLNAGESVIVGNHRIYCQGNGQSDRVESRVDRECVRIKKENYGLTPSKEVLLQWAKQCRTTVNEQRCSLISTSSDGHCVNQLINYYSYRPSDEILQQFETSCQAKLYSCP